MSQISESLKRRYAAVSKTAVASIHRHPQTDMATELRLLSDAISGSDERDNYGIGGCVKSFESQLSDLFNKPACIFLTTGTLAQCAAMKSYSDASKRKAIALHPTSHLLLHEHMAIEHLWGLQAISVGEASKVIQIDDLESLEANEICALIVELPMREIGGVLPSWQELVELRDWCTNNSVKMHMDGARIWQTGTFYSRSFAEIAGLFDSIYVSFYKDIGGLIGAALLGEQDFIAEARIWARRAGGNPITQYPEVIAARRGLETYLSQMPVFAAYAVDLCQSLNQLPVTILPTRPQACMFHLKFEIGQNDLVEKIVRYAENTGILVLPLPREGNNDYCICEISIGENALAQSVDYWLTHIRLCLSL